MISILEKRDMPCFASRPTLLAILDAAGAG